MTVVEEMDVVDRKISGKEYRIEHVPPGQRDDRVTAKIVCALDGWSYEGEPNPKRVDLCIVYYLVQKKSLSHAQLRWCANIGLNFGLKGSEVFGLDGDYETASEETLVVIHARVKRLTEALARSGDRMVIDMAKRSLRSQDGPRVFSWINPSTAGLFGGVQEALSGMATIAHRLNPLRRDSDDD